MDDVAFRQIVDSQARRMIDLASQREAFTQDCATNPGLLIQHWENEVCIEYVPRITDSYLSQSENTIMDDNASSEVIGLFSPALQGDDPYRIEIQYEEGDYTALRNFTLLHELGHYLQHTDNDLADTICDAENMNCGKRLEEAACNRFASLALLPDAYVERHLYQGRLTAIAANQIFKEGRERRKEFRYLVRVSRPAIVRRLGEWLPETGSIALIKNDVLRCRVHSDGHIDYEDTLSENEREAIERFESSENGDWPAEFSSADGSKVSIACSFAGRTHWYFVVVLP